MLEKNIIMEHWLLAVLARSKKHFAIIGRYAVEHYLMSSFIFLIWITSTRRLVLIQDLQRCVVFYFYSICFVPYLYLFLISYDCEFIGPLWPRYNFLSVLNVLLMMSQTLISSKAWHSPSRPLLINHWVLHRAIIAWCCTMFTAWRAR